MGENNDDLTDLTAQRDRLQAEVARLQVSKETGVPPHILGRANTVEEGRVIAQDALAWRGDQPSKPTTAAVYPSGGSVNGVSQVSRETLKHLTPEQVNQLYAENRLAGIGAPAPESRRTGEQHRNAAP